MFKEIRDKNPSKIFLEGVPKGNDARDYFSDNSGGVWAHIRNLSKTGVPIEGMDNQWLYDFDIRLMNKYDKLEISHSDFNKLFEEEDIRKTLPFMFDILIARFVHIPISSFVDKLRTFEMARYVARSLSDDDVAVMIHGIGHDVKGIIDFIGKGVHVEPINSSIEKDFELYGELFMASTNSN